MARRKSDKKKLEEGRGTGRGAEYVPWIKVHEFGSSGRAHRIYGFKTRRVHCFLSDQEAHYFFIAHWSDNVIDIREQFPLLPLKQTVLIAQEQGIKHPCEKNKVGQELVMTTDFVITVKTGSHVRDIVRTVKAASEINRRVKEKFKIEEEYWKKRI